MNTGNGPGRGARGEHNDPLGGMDDADVADMWVMNPDTGAFELRPPDAGISNAAEPPEAAVPHPRGRAADAPADSRAAEAATPTVPASRRRSRRADDDGNGDGNANGEEAEAPVGRAATRAGARAQAKAGARGRAGAKADAGGKGKGKSKGKKRIKWIAISVAGLIVVLAGSAYGYLQYLNSRIKTTQKNAGSDVPEAEKDEFGRKQLNIVLIGNDSREGLGKKYGAAEHTTGLADVTILMHISADRTNATMVSIPRDTMVDIPQCTVDGKTYPASNGKQSFNTSFANGGAPCTVSTLDKMLGIQTDHYIMIDFTGVKKMTDAVDGVDMCISEDINDPVLPNRQGGTDLFLKAGEQNLKGETALKFLRARHAFGDGSDLARIKAQKAFLMALARKLKNSASLTNVDGMFKLANIATESLTVDNGLGSVQKLVSLGNQIKKVPEKRMAFTTLPVEDYPPMPKSKVQPMEPNASEMFRMLREDVPFTEGEKSETKAPEAPKPQPAQVTVDVRNGSGVSNKAGKVATELAARGFVATSKGNALDKMIHQTSEITYPPGQLEAAKLLASHTGVEQSALKEGPAGTTTFELLIGKDFLNKLPDPTKSKPTAPPKSIDMQTADKVVCAPKKG